MGCEGLFRRLLPLWSSHQFEWQDGNSLYKVTDAHSYSIVCIEAIDELGLLATGDQEGHVHVWQMPVRKPHKA